MLFIGDTGEDCSAHSSLRLPGRQSSMSQESCTQKDDLENAAHW